MGCAALIGIACAVHYFWRLDIRRSLGYAAFAILVFCLFLLSGLWEENSRHSWGSLATIFVLIIVAAGAGVLFIRRILRKTGIFPGKDQ